MLSLKHCSGPVDPKFKIFCFHLLRGPKNRGGGQTSLGQKPKYKFFFSKTPLSMAICLAILLFGPHCHHLFGFGVASLFGLVTLYDWIGLVP